MYEVLQTFLCGRSVLTCPDGTSHDGTSRVWRAKVYGFGIT